jgi:hypothetical protein
VYVISGSTYISHTHLIEHSRSRQVAQQPHFPLGICDHTFELAQDYVSKLNYSGPLGLSCDDTKLFAAYRTYWDTQENTWFLVGATGNPMRMADVDELREILDNGATQKATKVCTINLEPPKRLS